MTTHPTVPENKVYHRRPASGTSPGGRVRNLVVRRDLALERSANLGWSVAKEPTELVEARS